MKKRFSVRTVVSFVSASFLVSQLLFLTPALAAGTWTDQTVGGGAHNWQTTASSADGTKLVAAVWGGDIRGLSSIFRSWS